MADGGNPVTELIARAASGDAGARARLFDRLYPELKRLAISAMRAERDDHTLQPTALVHEAYLRLLPHESGFESRSHFLGVAASAMRRILVDHARGHKAQKRGAGVTVVYRDDLDALPASGLDVLALDQLLSQLAALDDRQAQVVELRVFAGLSVEEAASVLGTSARTVKRDWQMAKAWLRREMAASRANVS